MAKTKARKQFEKEYNKVYKRIERYIKRFSDIGWEIPKRMIPPEKEKATKEHYKKFKDVYIKDFRSKLRKLQSEEVGKTLTGKKAKEIGKQREKEWREQRKKKTPTHIQRIKTIDNPIVTYPTFNVYEEIRSRLLDFPSGKWVQGSNGKPMYYEFNTNTNILISILDDNISLDGYEKYLLSKEEQIVAEFDSIIYKESTQDQCDYSFVTLANELDYGRLYMDKTSTAEELSNMSDYYSLFGL